jgi:hypothetical protein
MEEELKTITDTNIKQYLLQLTDKEIQTYFIAKDHLETSFDISLSNGFLEWKKKQQQQQQK